jgi:hypothetical protein
MDLFHPFLMDDPVHFQGGHSVKEHILTAQKDSALVRWHAVMHAPLAGCGASHLRGCLEELPYRGSCDDTPSNLQQQV